MKSILYRWLLTIFTAISSIIVLDAQYFVTPNGTSDYYEGETFEVTIMNDSQLPIPNCTLSYYRSWDGSTIVLNNFQTLPVGITTYTFTPEQQGFGYNIQFDINNSIYSQQVYILPTTSTLNFQYLYDYYSYRWGKPNHIEWYSQNLRIAKIELFDSKLNQWILMKDTFHCADGPNYFDWIGMQGSGKLSGYKFRITDLRHPINIFESVYFSMSDGLTDITEPFANSVYTAGDSISISITNNSTESLYNSSIYLVDDYGNKSLLNNSAIIYSYATFSGKFEIPYNFLASSKAYIKFGDQINNPINCGESGTFTINAALRGIKLSKPISGSYIKSGVNSELSGIAKSINYATLYYQLCETCQQIQLQSYFSTSGPSFSTNFFIPETTGYYPNAKLIITADSGYTMSQNIIVGDLPYFQILTPTDTSNWKCAKDNLVRINSRTSVPTYGYLYLVDADLNNYINYFSINLLANKATDINFYIGNNYDTEKNVYLQFNSYFDNATYRTDTFKLKPADPVIYNVYTSSSFLKNGETTQINWYSYYTDSVILYYSTDNQNWISIDTVYANSYNYNWTVPDLGGKFTNSYIKVAAKNNPTFFGKSSAVTISNQLPVIFNEPGIGKPVYAGKDQIINFSSDAILYGTFYLQYSLNNGDWMQLTYIYQINNANSFSCKMPDDLLNNDSIQFRITDYYGNSIGISSKFVVVSSYIPTIYMNSLSYGGYWITNYSNYINIKSDLNTFVNVLFSNDAGVSYKNILSNVQVTRGFQQLEVPANTFSESDAGSMRVLKIESVDKTVSSNPFLFTLSSYYPYYEIIQPIEGDVYKAGTSINFTIDNYGPSDSSALFSLSDNVNEYRELGRANLKAGRNSISMYLQEDLNACDSSRITISSNYNYSRTVTTPKLKLLPADPYITVEIPAKNEVYYANNGFNLMVKGLHVSDSILVEYSANGIDNWQLVDTLNYFDYSNGYANWVSYLLPNVYSTTSLIRVSDFKNPAIVDVSDYFTTSNKPDTLQFYKPAIGSSYKAGDTLNVELEYVGRMRSGVTIYFTTDSGKTRNWVTAYESAYLLGRKSFSYQIPVEAMSSDSACFIAVLNGFEGAEKEVWSPFFKITEIAPYINVYRPYSYEKYWVAGTPHDIGWNSVKVNKVKIEYSIDGTNWINIVDSTYNMQYAYITAPSVSGTFVNTRIKVSDANNPAVYGYSPYFTLSNVQPNISITQPSFGNEIKAGKETTVMFNYTGPDNSDMVEAKIIDLKTQNSKDLRGNNMPIVNGINKIIYQIPADLPQSDSCILVIQKTKNGYLVDTSEVFTVLGADPYIHIYSPTANSYIYGSQQFDIDYESINTGPVKVEFSKDGGITWKIVEPTIVGTLGRNIYSWKTDTFATIEPNCKIKISSINYPNIFGTSDLFTITNIKPSLTITSPNGGETFKAGNTYYVEFDYQGPSTIGKLLVSFNGGITYDYYDKIQSIGSGHNYCSWSISPFIDSSKLVRVRVETMELVADNSDNNFNVKLSDPQIKINWPSIMDGYLVSKSWRTVNFSTANVDYVDINISVYGDGIWTPIKSSFKCFNGSNEYSFPVPDIIGVSENSIIRISKTSDSTLVAYQKVMISDHEGSLFIMNPDSATHWYGGEFVNIDFNLVGLPNYGTVEFWLKTSTNSEQQIGYTNSLNSGFNSRNFTLPYQLNDDSLATVVAYYWEREYRRGPFVSKEFNTHPAKPSISLISPKVSDYLITNRNIDFTWYSVSVEDVDLLFSYDGGTNWDTIATHVICNNSYNKYPYTFTKGTTNGMFKIENKTKNLIAIADDITIYDGPLTLDLQYPNGGESFNAGTSFTVKFNYTGGYNTVSVFVALEGTQQWERVDTFTAHPGINNFVINIPYDVYPGKRFMKIVDNYGLYDISDSSFSVNPAIPFINVFAPAYGSLLLSDQYYDIKWKSFKADTVNIDFSYNDSTWTNIVTGLVVYKDTSAFKWKTPSLTGSNDAIVKISSMDGKVVGKSNWFKISKVAASLTVLNPNGGEIIASENNMNVVFDYNGSTNKYIEVLVSTDSGVMWNSLDISAIAVPGRDSISVYIPYYLASVNALVRIQEKGNPGFYDVSNNVFTITAASKSITVINPAEGAFLVSNTPRIIKWNSYNASNMRIEYSIDSTKNWILISKNVLSIDGTNTFNWNVPLVDRRYDTCKVRVSDGLTEATSGRFTISPTPPSTDTRLSSLLVDGNPIAGFNDTVYTYNYGVPYSTTVPPLVGGVPKDAKAKVSTVNTTVIPGTSYVDILAEDGISNRRYTINFSKQSPSEDAYLSGININGKPLAGFTSGSFSYTVNLPSYTKIIPTVAATKSATGSTIEYFQANNLNGTASIKVTSESGKTIKTYTVKFNLMAFDVLSANQIFSVYENKTAGTLVAKMPINNWADSLPLNITIKPGVGSDAFIVSDSGEIKVADASLLDYEKYHSIVLLVNVVAVDDLTKTEDELVTINILNVNESPVLKKAILNVAENVSIGDVIGNLEGYDPEGLGVAYSILKNVGVVSFNLSNDLIVEKSDSFNFELVSKLIVPVRIFELSGSKLSDTVNVEINILNVNETPIVQDMNLSVNENSINGHKVGQIIATDPDGDKLTFEDISSSKIFKIDSFSGDITVKDVSLLNYEKLPNKTITLRAMISDDSLVVIKDIPIEVLDVNEAPNVIDTVITIAENTNIGVTYTIKGGDVDANQTVKFYKTAGDPDGIFTLLTNGTLSITNNASLDYEKYKSIVLEVTCTDDGTPSLSSVGKITIKLNNINENPLISPQSFYVKENQKPGAIVAKVIASDPDSAQSLTYSLTSQSVIGVFNIQSDSGKIYITDATKIDFETYKSFWLNVRVTDNGSGNMVNEAKITIFLVDEPEKAITANFGWSFGDNNLVEFLDSSINATKWFWTYGDGSSFTGKPAYHIYDSPGLYNVCLTAVNETKAISDKICRNVQVGTPPCTMMADFSFGILDSVSISFNNESNGKDLAYYYWSFGDNKADYQKSPTHKYSESGFYVVSLTVMDSSKQCSSFKSKMVEVGSVSCISNFDFTVDSLDVNFINTSKGTLATYRWDYGDGSYSFAKEGKHTYKKDGLYRVELTVVNSNNTCMDFISIAVMAGNTRCSANFTYAVDEGTMDVTYANQNIGSSTNLLWSFGDGSFSAISNPAHSYKYPGFYNVGLSAYNESTKCADFFQETVVVGSPDADCESDFAYIVDPVTRKVQFYDKSKGNIDFYIWNFGDSVLYGNNAQGMAEPYYIFNKPGVHNVCLTVSTPSDVSNTTCKYVPVVSSSDLVCLADFSYNVTGNNKVIFKDKSIGNIVKWEWNFGDSTLSTSKDTIVKQYRYTSYFRVSLKVTNALGAIHKIYKLISTDLQAKGLKASFGYDPGEYNLKAGGYPVDFVGAGSGDQARLRWSFGDGEQDTTTTTPTHNYDNADTYEVCYEISDPVTGDSSTYCETITVEQTALGEIAQYDNKLNVSPNPVNTTARVIYHLKDNSSTELTVFDLTGRKVTSVMKISEAQGDHYYDWDLSSLKNGAYTIRLRTKWGSSTQSFIKQ